MAKGNYTLAIEVFFFGIVVVGQDLVIDL